MGQIVNDLKLILQNYFGTILLSLICINKKYIRDYLRFEVIYDATDGLQVRSSTKVPYVLQFPNSFRSRSMTCFWISPNKRNRLCVLF